MEIRSLFQGSINAPFTISIRIRKSEFGPYTLGIWRDYLKRSFPPDTWPRQCLASHDPLASWQPRNFAKYNDDV